jgi:hypothetical protein
MNLFKLSVVLLLIVSFSGCANLNNGSFFPEQNDVNYKDGWVYSEQDDRYLDGEEIRALLQGHTVSYLEENQTNEYFHQNGRIYVYYKAREEYHNGNWCIIDNKVCLEYEAFKLKCPKIKLYQNGEIASDESGGDEFRSENSFALKITKGDIYNIERTYEEENWQLYERKKCPTNP